MAKNQKNKKKKITLYNFFNPDTHGKGISKEDMEAPRTFGRFFKFLWTNISMLFTLNLLMVVGNFPLLISMLGLSGNFNIPTSSAPSVLFAPLYGAMQFSDSPVNAALFGIHGVPVQMSIITPTTKVLYACGILVLFTFGLVNVGSTYILRNMVKCEPIFFFHDFFHAIKRNFKQAMIFGIIDILMMVLLTYDAIFFYINATNTLNTILLGLMMFFILVFFIMRFYVYILIVTFDLPFRKIIKNSFILAIAGMKRNIVAVFGIILLAVVNYFIFSTIMPLGIILPFILTFAVGAFMAAYAAYPVIKKIMIDPYYSDKAGKSSDEEDALEAASEE